MTRTQESARQILQAWPERSGLPASLLAPLPAVVALFAIEGQPAFGVGVLASMSASGRARTKMREFGAAVDEALRDLGFRGDLGPETEGPTNPMVAGERVDLLRGTLSTTQIDQLGVLFEDYMRSSDADWTGVVLRAVRAVVKDAVDEGTRRTIIGRLPSLSSAHLRELQRLKDKPERARPRLGRRLPEVSALQVVLLQAGLIREAPAADDPPTGARLGEPPKPETELRITSLGLAALRMFGPMELTERT